jgi:hypothetical protein
MREPFENSAADAKIAASMGLAGRTRQQPPPFDPAQLSLFPALPPAARVQPAVRLTESAVARSVPPERPGVFFLKSVGADGLVSERVGRDDVDLRQRLLQLAREKVPNVLFGWILADDANEAYRLECYLWHAYGGAWAGIAGDAHPVPSERIPFLGCPDCDE